MGTNMKILMNTFNSSNRSFSPAGINVPALAISYNSVPSKSVRESTWTNRGFTLLNTFAELTAFLYPLSFPASPVIYTK